MEDVSCTQPSASVILSRLRYSSAGKKVTPVEFYSLIYIFLEFSVPEYTVYMYKDKVQPDVYNITDQVQ